MLNVIISPDDQFLRPGKTGSGLSKSQEYSLASQGEFPSPIKLGRRASGYLKSQTDSWKLYRLLKSQNKIDPDIKNWRDWEEQRLTSQQINKTV